MTIDNISSEELAKIVYEALEEKNGVDIRVLNLKNIDAAVSDYFIICNSKNSPHAEALQDFVLENALKQGNSKPFSLEGVSSDTWKLIDFVDVVVHIFSEDSREFYNLEKLWADAKIETFA